MGGATPAEEDVLPGSFQKIVDNLVWTTWVASATPTDGLRIRTGTSDSDAMEIGKERINYSEIRGAIEVNAARGLVLSGSVEPHAVEDDVVGGALVSRRYQVLHFGSWIAPCDLQSN